MKKHLEDLFTWFKNTLWVQLLHNPFHALDLTDDLGNTDHGKALPAILLISAIVAQFLGNQFSAITLTILGSLSYGYGAWRSFLKTRAVTSHEETRSTLTHNVTETIQRRIAEDGVDPTHD